MGHRGATNLPLNESWSLCERQQSIKSYYIYINTSTTTTIGVAAIPTAAAADYAESIWIYNIGTTCMYYIYIIHISRNESGSKKQTNETNAHYIIYIICMYSHVEVPIYSTRGQVFASDRIIGAYRYFYIRD